MPLLLALETSSTVCSVALYKGEQLLGSSELQIEKSHSSHITVMISQLLSNCNVELKQVSAVAVSGGPGSYTGLRIGSSAAKGLCFSLDIPLIEVSTLHGLAAQVIEATPNPERFLYCPMIDARRMEVYTCLLNHKLEEVVSIAPVIVSEGFLEKELLEQSVIFFGSGASKLKSLKKGVANALFINSILPSAKPVGRLALEKYKQEAFEDVAYYEPFYLKEVHITAPTKNKVN
ncbi:tRNA (adenosine(37)-N6)-threonylcarbamoyltransferase complex dimerization subunit type 1 TsaB [Pontibacter sp. 13R65]|uniref:tRNA (adenosine(37)-N6)-threonylcarbamoyltransferase complex dimerization subunit type 1 TsaB n=1 Tax=Pontibacter sp. 13R65 TaxID=3127458 RepID=UPI00301D6608